MNMAKFEPVISKYFNEPNSWTLEHYMNRDGYFGYASAKKAITRFEPKELVEEVKKSNLRGRGGAGFPAGVKWSFLPENGKPRYLAVNADESEPGTFKDRAIMAYDPHQLIDSMISTCWACQINHAYIFIRGEFVREAKRLQAAIDECYKAGILGEDVMGLGKFKLDMTVITGAGAYICGEETGLLSAAEGDRAYPKIKPPFPAVEGYFRHPTVINNVETIACVMHIVANGWEWFKSIGPESGPGPKLFCVSGHVKNPGLYEVALGTTLREIIDMAGGPVGNIKGIIPGGSSMPIMTADQIDTPADFDSIRAAGSFLGSAGLIVFNDETCIVNALLNLARFYHHESCGQCTPCREGLGWLEKLCHRIEFGHGKEGDVDLLNEVCTMIKGRTICFLADSLIMPVESYVKKFREEFDYHVEHKKCMTDTEPGKFKAPEHLALATT
jgi:NADH-quinone oxidoreductase subunit F